MYSISSNMIHVCIYVYMHITCVYINNIYIYIYNGLRVRPFKVSGGSPRPPPEQTPGNRVKKLKERLPESQTNKCVYIYIYIYTRCMYIYLSLSIYIYILIVKYDIDYAPDITKVNIHRNAPLNIHWTIPVNIHWASDNPLEHVTDN